MREPRIIFKKIVDLSLYEIEQLTLLTNSNYSHLTGILSWAKSKWIFRNFEIKIPDLPVNVSIAYLDEKFPVAWGISQENQRNDNEHIISIFVKEEYRRNKIGTKIYKTLVSKLNNDNLKLKFHPSDIAGKNFYKNVRK